MRNTSSLLIRSGLFALIATVAACGGGGGGSNPGQLVGGSVQGKPLSLTGEVSTLAGTPLSFRDGTGKQAIFSRLTNAAAGDATGANLYITDDNTIRRVVIATGEVTVFAGSATNAPGNLDGIGTAALFRNPTAVTRIGNALYVFDNGNGSLRKIALDTAQVTTVSLGGTISNVSVMANDGSSLYVVMQGRMIYRIDTSTTPAAVSLVAGSWSYGHGNGTGAAASFVNPMGLAVVGDHLYVAEANNCDIRDIQLSTQAVTTLAGDANACGSVDATGSAAQFQELFGMDTDGTNLYVADYAAHTVRKVVIASGEVTTLAGSAGAMGYTDGTGTAARFHYPQAVALVGGSLFISDTQPSGRIRRLALNDNSVTTLAGSVPGDDGIGSVARFNGPGKVTTDGVNLYVADSGDATIRKVVIATGEVTTLAGQVGVLGGDDGIGTAARFDSPSGITTDGTRLYVVDCGNNMIRAIVLATGAVTTLAGNGQSGYVDGTGAAARFNCPFGITTDGANLYVADGNNNAIRKVVIASGEVTTLAGGSNSGYQDGPGATALFNWPEGIATDGTYLYVVEDNCTLRKVEIATGVVSTVAGQSGVCSDTDGAAASASFFYPYDVTSDGTYLYVTDLNGNTVRKVDAAAGTVTTVAGTPNVQGSADGPALSATFNAPVGLTTDGKRLFVVDSSNNTIRAIR